MFRHYYPDRFPSLWERFDEMVETERMISVSEVSRELEGQDDRLRHGLAITRRFFIIQRTRKCYSSLKYLKCDIFKP